MLKGAAGIGSLDSPFHTMYLLLDALDITRTVPENHPQDEMHSISVFIMFIVPHIDARFVLCCVLPFKV